MTPSVPQPVPHVWDRRQQKSHCASDLITAYILDLSVGNQLSFNCHSIVVQSLHELLASYTTLN